MKKIIFVLLISTVLLTACGIDKVSKTNNEKNAEMIAQNNNIDMKIVPEKGDVIATLETSEGDITFLIYNEKAPETAKNFLELSKAGKYDGVVFHRVIKDFMLQTGDFENGNGTGGHSYKGKGTYLEDEFGEGLAHLRGVLSMANAGPNTGGSQFFIVQKDGGTDWLDGVHAIFGYVYDGMDVVDKIAALETGANDRPLEDVIIEKVVIDEY